VHEASHFTSEGVRRRAEIEDLVHRAAAQTCQSACAAARGYPRLEDVRCSSRSGDKHPSENVHYKRAAVGTGPRSIRDCDRTAAAVREKERFGDRARRADYVRSRLIIGGERASVRAWVARRHAACGPTKAMAVESVTGVPNGAAVTPTVMYATPATVSRSSMSVFLTVPPFVRT
jgi:hypothetical protein